MKMHVKMIFCTIEHVKILDMFTYRKSTQGWKYSTKSECLIQEYSMHLLVALLLITVLSP